jgi:F420-non-reducing hydrogenase small subunit
VEHPKPKLSVYWAASCGGCEIALVNVHEKLLEIDRHFEFFFCPCLLDTKVKDVEALPDRAIAITLFNGAIRTSENLEMARLMRRKSQVLVAYGACASMGSIPALSNLSSRDAHFQTIYGASGVFPQTRTAIAEGELELPQFSSSVQALAAVVDIDYSIPGCPPESHQVWSVLEALIDGRPLPPKGSVLGGGTSAVCAECGRNKSDKKIAEFCRTYEIVPDARECLMDQGVVCMGMATRDGCGALCPKVNMPCMGCYGPPEGVVDQGAKMIAALGSVLDAGDYKGMSEREVSDRAETAADGLADPAGTLYKFGLAARSAL